ncbi:MAG: hypothetical protein CM15mV101_100 [uncultured marine virus]|nr:MAG: hypothetical protein CM15mV101_100 [uncultured marine virus]
MGICISFILDVWGNATDNSTSKNQYSGSNTSISGGYTSTLINL